MKNLKTKLIVLFAATLCLLFFSNDFGLIDIENTAIVTALAVDKLENEYEVTAQIAVPEAKNTQSENKDTTVSGKGSTVAAAIKSIGNKTGWFPKLSFCNLIVIGKEIAEENSIKVLDYFSKTLRVQDSAVLVLAEKKAKELLSSTTPLDNFSSFALQKVLLKNQGFDKDVATVNVKDFASGYYSPSSSSYMPLIKITKEKQSDSQGANSEPTGSSSEETKKGSCIYDATTTALFKNGVKVGEMPSSLTAVFNLINSSASQTTFKINDVIIDGENSDCLITVLKNDNKITLTVTETELYFNAEVTVYCKISDDTSASSDYSFSQDIPLTDDVKIKSTEFFADKITELFNLELSTGCDFLNIEPMLYRYHHAFYDKYKNIYLNKVYPKINVTVKGQN